jgi:hypothetical protein
MLLRDPMTRRREANERLLSGVARNLNLQHLDMLSQRLSMAAFVARPSFYKFDSLL